MMAFSCGYASNDRKFWLPTIVVTIMAAGGTYAMIAALVTEKLPPTVLTKVVAFSFIILWIGVMGGVALLLLFGIIFPQRLFFEIEATSLRWKNSLISPIRTLDCNTVKTWQWYRNGPHPLLVIRDTQAKKYVIRSVCYLDAPQVEKIDQILTTVCRPILP